MFKFLVRDDNDLFQNKSYGFIVLSTDDSGHLLY